MERVKNAPIIPFAGITLIAAACIMLIPLDSILESMSLSTFQAEYIGLALKMTLLFAISYTIIRKTNLQPIAGLSPKYRWRFKAYNLIPLYLIALGVLSAMSYDLTHVQLQNVLLLLVACLSVGFAEEFLFRGLLQSMFLRKYHTHRRGILLGILFPAILFGVFHLLNLVHNDNVPAVLVQVVFATFIGFFFGVLVLKTNKIIPVAITHGLINFSFSIPFLPGVNAGEPAGFSIAPILITLPLFILGLLMVKKIDREEVQQKIHQSFSQHQSELS